MPTIANIDIPAEIIITMSDVLASIHLASNW